MNGLWETLPSGQIQRQLPNETDPSVRKDLIDAAERDESMRQRLFEIRARLDFTSGRISSFMDPSYISLNGTT